MTVGAAGSPAASGVSYSLVNHACRHCGGRVLQAGEFYRCSVCAAGSIGSPKEMCGCGVLPNAKLGRSQMRCGINPNKSVQSPAEIVILLDDRVAV